MLLRSLLSGLILLGGCGRTDRALADTTLEKAGTAVALPLTAGAIAWYKDDRKGMAQLVVETILTVGTAYGLKQFVREKRPDRSDYQSVPSNTTAVAASGSSYLWGRYGWEYGLPAFAATQFVSTRVEVKQHHWYDTLASSAMAAGYGFFVTIPFKRRYAIRTGLKGFPDTVRYIFPSILIESP